jgi:flagellin
MREIVVQAADGSNSASDRAVLDVEFKEAASEIDRIVDVTEFNGKKLLNGSAGGANDSTVSFQIGANATQTLEVEFSDFNLAAGTAATAGDAQTYTYDATDAQAAALTSFTLTDQDGIVTTIAVAGLTTTEALATLIDTDLGSAYSTSVTGDTITITAAENKAQTLTVAATGPAPNAPTPALTSTITGAPPLAATPMGADLSSYVTVGMGTGYDATLNALDTAISGVATQRATFGATMNRLEYAVDNLASSSLATATARGRIEDANYATETTALARTQIISQAGTAMLAQANQKSQSVLSLLQ